MILDKFKIPNKIAIVTGAMGGMGFAIADALGEAGAKLILTDMKEDKSFLDKLKTKNYTFEFIKGNITNPDFPEELINFAIESFDNLQKSPQSSAIAATYYPKRSPKDSEIDPNRPISEQFDLIRVCDPNRFPAFLYHRGEAYKIILEKL